MQDKSASTLELAGPDQADMERSIEPGPTSMEESIYAEEMLTEA